MSAISPHELWGYAEIAAYMKLAKTYVADRVTRAPGFPVPRRPMGPKSHPRWVAREVVQWAEDRF